MPTAEVLEQIKVDKEIIPGDEYFNEKVEPIYTYSNGAKSFYADKEYTSRSYFTHPMQPNGVTITIKHPAQIALERLVIGRNSKGYSFQILRFAKNLEDVFSPKYHKLPIKKPRPNNWEYVGDEDMERYEGVSFTEKTMKQIIDTINLM